MREFFKQPIVIIVLAITTILLALMIYSYATGGNNILSNTVGVVVTPLQKGVTVVKTFVSDKLSYFTEFNNLKKENITLKAKVRQNKADQTELTQLRMENERLKLYLGLKDAHPDFELTLGQVIAREPGSYFTRFTLDKGSIHGVKVNDAVMTAEGLVGVVYEVGTSYCKVMSMLEEGMPMGAIISRTRDVAVLEGDAELKAKGLGKITLLPTRQSAETGDQVETSGTGGVFPKGLIIGTVTNVLPDTGGALYYATIQPAADLKSVRDVMIVTSYNAN